MLKHVKNHYFGHKKYYHLGDIVNIIMQVNQYTPGFYYICSGICPCCGIDGGKMMRCVLSLLDTKIQYKQSENFIEMKPTWRANAPNPTYIKAKKLPKQKDYTVVQFDKRSAGDKVPNFKHLIKPSMINIGDKELPCINRTELNLLDKFEILASAQQYIGIDSGLTHLALLSNVSIVVVHPKSWDASRFYPKCSQLRFLEI